VATEGSRHEPRSAPPGDPDERAGHLASEALAAGDPTGWFDRLYAAAEAGQAVVPWDRGAPHYALVGWADAVRVDGPGRRAAVVGCGLGDDAEFVAGLGYETVAFDVAGGAIRAARRRFPRSAVRYVTADVLDPPASWHHAFDLVVESLTVQALPDPPRRAAIASIGRLVAPGGTLIVIALARADGDDPEPGPPWALSRAEIDSFAGSGLQAVRIEELRDPGPLATHRWRAQFRRP
jgi:SAM-dependent methyltransferase